MRGLGWLYLFLGWLCFCLPWLCQASVVFSMQHRVRRLLPLRPQTRRVLPQDRLNVLLVPKSACHFFLCWREGTACTRGVVPTTVAQCHELTKTLNQNGSRGTKAQRSGCDLLVVVLQLLSHETWLVVRQLRAGVVAPVVRCPLPLPELACGVAKLGCDHGWHQHVPLRVPSVPVVGGDTVPGIETPRNRTYSHTAAGAHAWPQFSCAGPCTHRRGSSAVVHACVGSAGWLAAWQLLECVCDVPGPRRGSARVLFCDLIAGATRAMTWRVGTRAEDCASRKRCGAVTGYTSSTGTASAG